MKKEIRLYGLDAPEVKINRKIIEDERGRREKQFTCPIIAPIWFAILALRFVGCTA